MNNLKVNGRGLLNVIKGGFSTWEEGKTPYTIPLINKKHGELLMKPLNPDSSEDLETFKSIISHASVAKTSSWMAYLFGKEKLQEAIKGEDNPDKAIAELVSTKAKEVEEIYRIFTQYNTEYKLGYCGVYDQQNDLLGGCGIIPFSINNDGKPETWDVSLHILPGKQRGGLGTDLMKKMLDYSLGEDSLGEEPRVPKIVGKLLDDKITPIVCAQFGFIMEANNGELHYLLTDEMWKNNRPEFEGPVSEYSALRII